MFNILISSTDDHLRNQGFLMTSASKWELSPAFDINPAPDGGTLKTAISEIHGNTPCIKSLVDAGPFFEVTEVDAKRMAKDMAGTISTRWRPLSAELGMSGKDVKLITPALDNEQIQVALKM
jgi:serine/threonine-protein kinase HipA